jgi:hypothetical protein
MVDLVAGWATYSAAAINIEVPAKRDALTGAWEHLCCSRGGDGKPGRVMARRGTPHPQRGKSSKYIAEP